MTDHENSMQAIVHERYGRPDVLELREVDKPVIEDDQVLVRVHASSVNPVEWYGVTGPYFARFGNGLRTPKDPAVGADLAGRIEAVGRDVTELQPGDEVFGTSGGSWAEYAAARPEKLARKPANVSFEEAAAVPIAGITALQALRDHGHVQPGQKVLINGASGGVGTFAVQLAKAFGADVTAVCSTRNVEQARALGADRVVDYTQEDFTKRGERHDLMLDIAGKPLVPGLQAGVDSRGDRRGDRRTDDVSRARTSPPHRRNDLEVTGPQPEGGLLRREDQHRGPRCPGRASRGRKVRSVIDREYPLSEAAEALTYLGEGHARGKSSSPSETSPTPTSRQTHGAAQESNLPSRGLHDRTGFEDQLGHRAHAAP